MRRSSARSSNARDAVLTCHDKPTRERICEAKITDQCEDDSDESLDQAEVDSLDDDDFDNSYTDSERYGSPEDDAAPLRGTSQCDGRCDPICDWCLIAHDCPSACKGGICPYELQVIEDIHGPYYAAGVYDAIEKTKRARLSALSNQREYFAGYESHVRRNDPRRKRAELKRQTRYTSTYIIGF